jgi:AraC-like DNA-binding protein
MRRKDEISIESFRCYQVQSNERNSGSHCHDDYEIFYFFGNDNIERMVGDRKYVLTPHSVLLIPGSISHNWQYSHPWWVLSIHFSPTFLTDSERLLLLPLFNSKNTLFLDQYPFLLDSFARSIMECKNMEGEIQKIAVHSRVVSLLTQISSNRKDTSILPIPTVYDKRVGDILEYISCNLRKSISLNILSQYFGISKNYINVLFKKELNVTFGKYLRSQKLHLARHEILNGKHMEEAAYNAGFNDYSTFFRAYKSLFKETPMFTLSSASVAIMPSGD